MSGAATSSEGVGRAATTNGCRICVVVGCSSRFPDVAMARLPKTIAERKEWAPLIGQHWYDLPATGRVCMRHFDEQTDVVLKMRPLVYDTNMKETPHTHVQLKPGVLPTLNLPGDILASTDYAEAIKYGRLVLGNTTFGDDNDDECLLKEHKDNPEYVSSVLHFLKDANNKLDTVRQMRLKLMAEEAKQNRGGDVDDIDYEEYYSDQEAVAEADTEGSGDKADTAVAAKAVAPNPFAAVAARDFAIFKRVNQQPTVPSQ